MSASLTIQYDKMLFILEPTDFSRGLVRKRVTVSDYQDGRVVIAHNGRPLAYSIFDKVRQVDPAAIADNKSLSAVLIKIREEQLQRPQRRSSVAPRRRSQDNSIFGARIPIAPSDDLLTDPEQEVQPEMLLEPTVQQPQPPARTAVLELTPPLRARRHIRE